MKAVVSLAASVLLIGGCFTDRPSPPSAGNPEPCDLSQLEMTAGRSGPAAGTMYLTFTVELVDGPPCLIVTWPAVDISDGAGRVIAQGAGNPTGPPMATLLDTVLEFHLGWASWCGPDPSGPLTARVGLIADQLSKMAIPSRFGPSGCQGAQTILFVDPGW